ncbi:DUF1801 domain-containing protein [Maritimibacter sp. DP1N21-5]|uniref:DUF1801 domain-containing protein n=1 Tax=Maritimibacter sp. DP1N21-5 TaxID=2836867 RepID=UPI001C46C5F0|nr:DUF1801 domain-containing protein [Maritimibacter sp. DP1N21-5]MBV7408574.1 DUF1801 domain-containing protein [Maritimibacter sp. DP1N21-5]
MAENKTQPTSDSVDAFLDAVQPDRRQEDARRLDALFRKVTGWSPVLWGPSIVGYGSYHYRYGSGREGDFLATGFSPRKANLVLYIMPGYQDYGALLADLGKHKLGKSCLYLNKLADVDQDVLARLVRRGLDDLGKIYPVQPS